MIVIVLLFGGLLFGFIDGQIAQQQPIVSGCGTVQCSQDYRVPTINIGMTCAPGFSLQYGLCYRKLVVTCPAGSLIVNGQCVRILTEKPLCPLGSEIRDGTCVKIFDQICPVGYQMINEICTRYEPVPVNCPPGSLLQGNECVTIECPKNYQLENGWCVAISNEVTPGCKLTCHPGHHLINNMCYPNSKTTLTIVPQPPINPCSGSSTVQPVPRQTCGDGFVIRNKACIREEIECPEGTFRRGDRCERISCPPPSIWNGQFCVYHTPSSQGAADANSTNIFNNTHTVHNFNNVTHDTNVNVNNVNNVYIYKEGEVIKVSNGTSNHTVTTVAPEPQKERCCTVVTPRICKQVQNKWRCYNRKYHRCGVFCTQPVIQLRPTHPINRPPNLVMTPNPPIQPNCGSSGCTGQINCSGCDTGGFCSPICYQYSCNNECVYQDHQSFCSEFDGPGCGEDDGCYA